jgi:hypothetical protein
MSRSGDIHHAPTSLAGNAAGTVPFDISPLENCAYYG